MQKSINKFHIFGSGFKAIYLALSLKKKFHNSSITINTRNNFFGAYDYKVISNLYLDYGCHLFSNNKKIKDCFELKKKEINPIKLKYASVNNFGKTNGFSIYDFRNHTDITKITKDFETNIFGKKNIVSNLQNFFTNIYGKKITKIIDNFCKKMTGLRLMDLDHRSNEFLFFNRLLLYNTSKSLNLKKGILEPILATPFRYNFDLSDGYISFAFKNGNYGFVKKIHHLFKKYDINFSDNPAKSSKILDLRPKDMIYEKKMSIKIPLHLVYFLVEKYQYTFIHDYSDSPIFRISSPGFYTHQFIHQKKHSYICIEVPDPEFKYDKNFLIKLSKKYIKTKKIQFLEYLFLKQSYPTIYKKNYDISNYSIVNPTLYSKDKIMNAIDNYLNLV